MPREKGLRFRGFVIAESELDWSFDTPGGPGGQHANRSSTRATLSFDIGASTAFPHATRERVVGYLGPRIRNGVVSVTADDTRSQWRNRAIARRRLMDLLDEALVPERTRHQTNPPRSARRRRLESKKRRSATKRLRRQPDLED